MNTIPSSIAAEDSVAVPCAQGPAWQPPRILRRYRELAELDSLLARMAPDWLSEREQAELAAWRDATRRQGWHLSRILGKQLVAETVGAPFHEIEILSRDDAGRVNRPRLRRHGAELPWSLSISHSDRGVLVALAAAEGVGLGVDLTQVEALSPRVAELWFTPAELAWYRDTASDRIGAYIWSAKEALYKAISDGRSFAPREFEISRNGLCSYRGQLLADCRLQSWSVDGHLAVFALLRMSQPSNHS